MGGRVWTDEEIEWIRENYSKEHVPHLLDQFEKRFGRRPTAGALAQKAYKLGLRHSREKAPDTMTKRIIWAREPAYNAWMNEHDVGQAVPALSEQFEAEFGFPLSRGQVNVWRANNGRQMRPRRPGGGRPRKPIGFERRTKGGGSWSRCAKNRLYRCQKTIGSSSTTSSTERCMARFPMDTTSCVPIRTRSTAHLKTSSPYRIGLWLASTLPIHRTGMMPNRSGNVWRFASSRQASTRPSCRCRGHVASAARHSCRTRAKVPTTRIATERRALNAEHRVSRHTASAPQS